MSDYNCVLTVLEMMKENSSIFFEGSASRFPYLPDSAETTARRIARFFL